jgi:hypothetical protein
MSPGKGLFGSYWSRRSLYCRRSLTVPDTYHQAGIERGTSTSASTVRATTSPTASTIPVKILLTKC